MDIESVRQRIKTFERKIEELKDRLLSLEEKVQKVNRQNIQGSNNADRLARLEGDHEDLEHRVRKLERKSDD